MSVRALWTIVAVIWTVLSIWLHFGLQGLLIGYVICAVFAVFGVLAGKRGIYR